MQQPVDRRINISRRVFLERALGVAAAGTVGLLSGCGTSTATAGRDSGLEGATSVTPSTIADECMDVLVLGGGIAGLTAAHELVERGYRVAVVESTRYGGKAKSLPVPDTGVGSRDDLPGEHSLRVFFGFYQHLPATMRRIPFEGSANGVWDNLKALGQWWFGRDMGRAADILPLTTAAISSLTPASLEHILRGLFDFGAHVPADEVGYWVRQQLVFMTSSDERRLGQWEQTPWWTFLGAATRSRDYQHVFVNALTQNIAAQIPIGSTRTIGTYHEATLYNLLGLGKDGTAQHPDGPVDRVLNGPTNEVFIDPWVEHLKGLGVTFVKGRVEGLAMIRGQVTDAIVSDATGLRSKLRAKWFVVALPMEVARQLWDQSILGADPSLARMNQLTTTWSNGIQIFLKDRYDFLPGHLLAADSAWQIAAAFQQQFWQRSLPTDYGDGTVRDVLSAAISDWGTPGIVYGKAARDCTSQEIFIEVWAQIRQSLQGQNIDLPDSTVHSFFLDPAIKLRADGYAETTDEAALFTCLTNSWALRPGAATQIANLALAGDYVKTNTDVTTMEAACEAGRRAANVILDRSGSPESKAEVFTLYEPSEFRPLKDIDAQRFQEGKPHILLAADGLAQPLFGLDPL